MPTTYDEVSYVNDERGFTARISKWNDRGDWYVEVFDRDGNIRYDYMASSFASARRNLTKTYKGFRKVS